MKLLGFLSCVSVLFISAESFFLTDSLCLNMVNCFMDPCMGKTCPGHPSAICKPNYCGGCNYAFYDLGQKITTW